MTFCFWFQVVIPWFGALFSSWWAKSFWFCPMPTLVTLFLDSHSCFCLFRGSESELEPPSTNGDRYGSFQLLENKLKIVIALCCLTKVLGHISRWSSNTSYGSVCPIQVIQVNCVKHNLSDQSYKYNICISCVCNTITTIFPNLDWHDLSI